jgi:hypothetical protein
VSSTTSRLNADYRAFSALLRSVPVKEVLSESSTGYQSARRLRASGGITVTSQFEMSDVGKKLDILYAP